MHDYDTEYRRLRAAGLEGWAGSQHERNHARLAETLDRLARESFPKPPARVLELGCGAGMSSSHWMARKGYDVHGGWVRGTRHQPQRQSMVGPRDDDLPTHGYLEHCQVGRIGLHRNGRPITSMVSRTRCSVLTMRRRAGTHCSVVQHGPRFSSAPLRAALRPGHESGCQSSSFIGLTAFCFS
jgi:hypothetical protein